MSNSNTIARKDENTEKGKNFSCSRLRVEINVEVNNDSKRQGHVGSHLGGWKPER
jgi:hypothetical protein